MSIDLDIQPSRAARSPHVRHAWWCVVASPLAFALAFIGGEWLSAVLGYTGEGEPPWWVGGTAVLAAVVVLTAPTVLALWFARRAGRKGDTGAACQQR